MSSGTIQARHRLTREESAFAFAELRHGRMHGYHLASCDYPLRCYAPDHPEDAATMIFDRGTERGFHPVTTAECDGIISRNIKGIMDVKGIHRGDLATVFNRSPGTIDNRLNSPSTMSKDEVNALCEILGTSLDQLIWHKSTDHDQTRPLPTDKLTSVYETLSEKHRMMISDMVWELFDSECSRAEVDRLNNDAAEIIRELCPPSAASDRESK